MRIHFRKEIFMLKKAEDVLRITFEREIDLPAVPEIGWLLDSRSEMNREEVKEICIDDNKIACYVEQQKYASQEELDACIDSLTRFGWKELRRDELRIEDHLVDRYRIKLKR